jgi:DNA-binding NarL/FixJ family response regulator
LPDTGDSIGCRKTGTAGNLSVGLKIVSWREGGVLIDLNGDMASRSASHDNGAPGDGVHLTPTQRKVLDGVHSGRLNKQIAYDLGIAEATVKAHMTILMRKLNVRNRTQVAIVAELMNGERKAARG